MEEHLFSSSYGLDPDFGLGAKITASPIASRTFNSFLKNEPQDYFNSSWNSLAMQDDSINPFTFENDVPLCEGIDVISILYGEDQQSSIDSVTEVVHELTPKENIAKNSPQDDIPIIEVENYIDFDEPMPEVQLVCDSYISDRKDEFEKEAYDAISPNLLFQDDKIANSDLITDTDAAMVDDLSDILSDTDVLTLKQAFEIDGSEDLLKNLLNEPMPSTPISCTPHHSYEIQSVSSWGSDSVSSPSSCNSIYDTSEEDYAPVKPKSIRQSSTRKKQQNKAPRKRKVVDERNRYLRKKEQNKEAALRYRQKKKSEEDKANLKLKREEEINEELKNTYKDLKKELTLLKKLIRETFIAKGVVPADAFKVKRLK